MPDILFPNREALPEELRAFAKDAEGGVVINLVPNEKLKEFRDNNIAVSKERDEFKKIVEKVQTIFPEFDPDKVTSEISELRGIKQRVADGQLTESKSIEEALAERTKQMQAKYEADLAARAAEFKKVQERNSILDSRIRDQAIKQAVLSVVTDEKSGVHPSAIEDIISRARGVFVVEGDGERVTPKVGDSVLYGSDGTTPMSVSEWVATLKDKSPHLFKQSTGGAGNGTTGVGGKFGGFTEEEFSKLSPEQKLEIANNQSRPKGF